MSEKDLMYRLMDMEMQLRDALPLPPPLVWSEPMPPNGETCYYDHVTASSGAGMFQLEWKGWKEHGDSIGVFLEGEYITTEAVLDKAKEAAHQHLVKLMRAISSGVCLVN
jgi:hypothetical protein